MSCWAYRMRSPIWLCCLSASFPCRALELSKIVRNSLTCPAKVGASFETRFASSLRRVNDHLLYPRTINSRLARISFLTIHPSHSPKTKRSTRRQRHFRFTAISITPSPIAPLNVPGELPSEISIRGSWAESGVLLIAIAQFVSH